MNRSFAVILVSVALSACGSSERDGRVVASGHIEANDIRVATKVRGRLLQRPVDEGDAVKAGQLLGVVDTVDAELSLREAVALRDQADAGLRLRIAGSRREDVAELAARVDSAVAGLHGADKSRDAKSGG
jgi:HlyD family secretion protein